MSRPKLVREIAELKGSTRKHPERYRNIPPEVQYPLGDPPDHLSAGAKGVWVEISTYAPCKVLKGADRTALEIASNLLFEYRQAPAEFAVGKYTPLIRLLSLFGMTPVDRQKLGTEKPKGGAGDFDDF